MNIEVESADHILRVLINAVKAGHVSSPRQRPTHELTGVLVTLTNPRNRLVQNPARAIKKHYAAASVAWNLAERHDVESICYWNESGRGISDDGINFHGANYGERWHNSLWQDLALLSKVDLESRRAWVQIYDPTIDGGSYAAHGRDVPCTIGFGLHVIDGKLEFQTIMRSQSVVGVLPYDIFLFTTMQELIANQLGVGLGVYKHYCLSAHIYEDEIELANKTAEWYKNNPDFEPRAMAPISYNVTEATERWPRAMDLLEAGWIIENPDEFQRMMLEFAEAQKP